MKQNFWQSKNFWTQVITLVLSIAAIGGANLDAKDVATKLVANSSQIWALGGVIIVNVINPLWHWFKTPQVDRWAFLHSMNWWQNCAALIVGIGVMMGIYNEGIYNDVPYLVKYIFERNWNDLIFVALSSFILPLIKIFVKKPTPQLN